MEVKRFPVEVKATSTTEDGKKGIVEMFVSVMGNVDLGGDKVIPGAFDDAIKRIKESGRPLPVIWSHMWSDPKAYVGEHIDLEEKTIDGKTGLWAKQSYDLTKSAEQSHASQVFDLLARGLVTQASFAYDVLDYSLVDPAEGETSRRWDGKVRELRKLDLFEAGPCLLGMNPETDLIEAASRSKNGVPELAELESARSLIDRLITEAKSAESGEDDHQDDGQSQTGDGEKNIEADRFARLIALTE